MKRVMRAFCAVFAVIVLGLSFFSCGGKDDRPAEARDLIWAIGTVLPKAEDFFTALPDGATVTFAEKTPYANVQAGENEISLIYRSEKGKKKSFSVVLTLIRDTTPPAVQGAKDIAAYVGEGVAYRAGITLTDNCGGELRLEVDSSAVDTAREGVYPVFYWVTDPAGNRSVTEVKVHVYAERITKDMLNERIDALIHELGLYGLSKEAQARAIYQFVHTDAHITYVDTSDKTDWVREAYFTLMNRRGDCFSYFALSKAFFERLGIENMDIQRLQGYTTDTHYWSLINIAAAGEPDRWYHYDATRLRDVFYSGCLLTDAQVDAFSQQRANFYLYDRSQYPATYGVVITPRPDLT